MKDRKHQKGEIPTREAFQGVNVTSDTTLKTSDMGISN